MTNERTLEELYAVVEHVVQEPGIHETEVKDMLGEAIQFGEGAVGYFRQITAGLTRRIYFAKNTYHQTISDYDFGQRLLDELSQPSSNPQ